MNMGCDFILEDSFEDGCSICLEPFTSLDPASMTKCKHEYHLHCILEWSQRRIECPVCLQHLVLNDPASQEMLVAAERANKLRANQANQKNENSPSEREPDYERRMMRRVAAAAVMSARMITRRRRPSTPASGPSRILPSTPITSSSNVPHAVPTYCFSSVTPADVQIDSRQSPSRRGRSRSTELSAISESLRSKLSTASVRYRESLSKGTRSLKEKLISRNDSVKELSRGVQREMSAGIAGIARLISRKRAGICVVPSSTSTAGTSHSRREVRRVEDDSIVESLLSTKGDMSSNPAIATTQEV